MLVKNLPEIEDIHRLREILEWLGVAVSSRDGGVQLDPSGLHFDGTLPNDLMPKLRASNLLVGPLLARHGKVQFPHPGGCIIGRRPIDFFLDGLRSLGAEVEVQRDRYSVTAPRGLKGSTFVFPRQSHTGTEMMIMAASLADGVTTLVNAAMEPEVVALGQYLQSCGAKIEGLGSPIVTITGVSSLSAGTFDIAPDRIEAGSFLAMAAATKSDLTVSGCRPSELLVPLQLMRQMGVPLEVGNDWVRVKPWDKIEAAGFTTHEYPGFPTDIQAPFTVLMTQATGTALVHETVFEGRLFYIDLLNRMGANITLCDPHRALVSGPTPLRGKFVESPDVRAGLAMVVAGMVASGTTTIGNAYQIDRGYQSLEQRLSQVGATISRPADLR
jgi:UDP-N-acetylglucosamine 1-carboxyvinyltransferase